MMVQFGWKDMRWLTEAVEKLDKMQEGQEPGKFWGSREQEGVECLKCFTYRNCHASQRWCIVPYP